jgi:hypothetical protein
MSWSRCVLVLLVLAGLVTPAPAGLFSRKPKANPAERVPELLIQLRTSTDEAQRTAAAEELRQYDPRSFPEIMTGLIDALGRDASPAVRSEAATSLGRLRPLSQPAGYALEQAQNNDSSMRVRMSARQALWQYHLVGYRSGKPAETPSKPNGADATVSAPATRSAGTPPSTPAAAMPRQTVQQPRPQHGSVRETAEPPLAVPPGAEGTPLSATPVFRPKAAVPTQLIPVNPPKLQPAPAAPANLAPTKKPTTPAKPDDDGPSLLPPPE